MTEHHKQVAQQLRSVLAEQGITIQHAHALHIVAAAYGLPNWNTLAARPLTPALSPQEATERLYERLSDYADKEPSLELEFSETTLLSVRQADPDAPRMGTEEWFKQMNEQGTRVLSPVTAAHVEQNPEGHYWSIQLLEHGKGHEGKPLLPPLYFQQVTAPVPERSPEEEAAALRDLLEKQYIKVTEKEAGEWQPKLAELTTGDSGATLLIRRMVYDTYLRDRKATQAQGKKHRGRGEYENALLIRALCRYAGVPEPTNDLVAAREARLDEIMSDPFLQAEWFEELDIMN